MNEDSKVRTAVQSDEDGIMSLLRLMWDENGVFSMSEDKVRSLLRRCWAKSGCLIGVIGPVGSPIACACVVIGDTWYTDEMSLSDAFVFVHPDHRRSRNAIHLLEFMKKCAETTGLVLTSGVFGGDKNEEKIRLYSRRMGKQAGAYFIYNPISAGEA